MLEQNVERVRRAFEAIGRRDTSAILAEVPANFELHPLISVWERTYLGHDGIERWRRDLDDIWEEFRVDISEFRDVGDEAVLVLAQWRGRAKGATTELHGPAAAVIRFDGSTPVRADFYLDESRAIEAIESER